MKRCLAAAILVAVAATGHLRAQLDDAFVAAHQPRLQELFEALDPGHPDLGPVIRKWQAGNRTGAARELDAWFALKPFPIELLEPLHYPGDYREQADAALQRSFLLLGRWETLASRPDGGPDWSDRGSRGDKERAWMLNRHSFLASLARAHAETGNQAYRDGLNQIWQDWILNSPYPARLTFSPQWRPLEVARRILNSWTHLFYTDGLLDPGTRLLVLCSIREHGDALRHHASFWGGNHLISEKLALFTLAVAWPEFSGAEEWRAYASERFSREILRQTYPDGSYMELSNHYQLVVLQSAQYFLRLLAATDPGFRQLPVFARIEAMWDFFAGVMRPDGFGPLNNDSDLEHNAGFVADAWELFGRRDWLAMATRGSRGSLPTGSPSRFHPWAGQVVIRSGWDARADWIYFDAGPYGTAHQHTDRLHVSASLNGRPVLVDTGRYTYQPGPWRDFFSGPQGHSVLMLDGRAAARGPRRTSAPLPVLFEEHPACVFTAATARFDPPQARFGLPALAAPVPWTRAILYDPRGFAILLDHVVAFGSHALQASWHFHPQVSEAEAVRFLRPAAGPPLARSLASGRETPPLGGFFSPDYNRKVPAPLARFTTRIESPTTLFWILQDPAAPELGLRLLSGPGAPVARFQVIQSGRAVATVRVRLHPQPALLEYTPH